MVYIHIQNPVPELNLAIQRSFADASPCLMISCFKKFLVKMVPYLIGLYPEKGSQVRKLMFL